MIRLITGIPGAGKTLLAVELILDEMAKGGRPVFANINGLSHEKIRSFPLEKPEEWFDLPDGSLIVIDECQQHFPPRPSGSKVPECVARFETHRHQGLDIILVTQHPSLIDQNIRRLVELHQHCYRAFGRKGRTILQWNVCNLDPNPKQSESTAERQSKKFDARLFDYYKSASLHTDRARWPYRKIATFGLALLVVIGGFGYVISSIKGRHQQESEELIVEDAPKEQYFSDVATASQQLAVLPGPTPSLTYRGSIISKQSMTIWLEDPWSQRYYHLDDFEGYRKGPPGTVIMVTAGYGEYEVSSSELYNLLP